MLQIAEGNEQQVLENEKQRQTLEAELKAMQQKKEQQAKLQKSAANEEAATPMKETLSADISGLLADKSRLEAENIKMRSELEGAQKALAAEVEGLRAELTACGERANQQAEELKRAEKAEEERKVAHHNAMRQCTSLKKVSSVGTVGT